LFHKGNAELVHKKSRVRVMRDLYSIISIN
jgi:hypothetical protein